MREGVADAARLAEARFAMHQRLCAGGPHLSPRLTSAFLYVPRHPFLPWAEAMGHGEVPLVQAEMLDALDVGPGSRVLEVGTGSGYGTALLSWLAGRGNVTSTGAAEPLLDRARERLGCVGYRPVLAVADAGAGWAPRAPYDRLISQVPVERVPTAWLEQCVPGALLVAPLGGALARLQVGPEGSASGRFLHVPAGEPLPAVGRSDGTGSDDEPADDGVPLGWPGLVRSTDVPGSALCDLSFAFFARLHLPGTVLAETPAQGQLLTSPDGARAHVVGRTVTVAGHRDLWAVVERAHARWLALHRPRREWFEVLIAGRRQWITYRAPDGGEHTWDLVDP